jgi:hypothetical protein
LGEMSFSFWNEKHCGVPEAIVLLGILKNDLFEAMGKQGLNLFEGLLQAPKKKSARVDKLLRDPELHEAPGWFMYVPQRFNDALDIKQTERVVDGKDFKMDSRC